jgi:hypothetical protein
VRSELAKAEASGRTGAEMTEWVRPLERQLLNTQSFLRSEGLEGVAAQAEKLAAQEQAGSGLQNGNRHEREEERNHALPFED